MRHRNAHNINLLSLITCCDEQLFDRMRMITTNVHDKIFLLQRNFMGNTK